MPDETRRACWRLSRARCATASSAWPSSSRSSSRCCSACRACARRASTSPTRSSPGCARESCLEVLSCVGYVVLFGLVFGRLGRRLTSRLSLSELAVNSVVSVSGLAGIALGRVGAAHEGDLGRADRQALGADLRADERGQRRGGRRDRRADVARACCPARATRCSRCCRRRRRSRRSSGRSRSRHGRAERPPRSGWSTVARPSR